VREKMKFVQVKNLTEREETRRKKCTGIGKTFFSCFEVGKTTTAEKLLRQKIDLVIRLKRNIDQ
jgi:hypothetical protein